MPTSAVCKGLLRLATKTADKNGILSVAGDSFQARRRTNLRPMTTPTSRAARKGYFVAPEPNALSVVISRDFGRRTLTAGMR